MKAADIVTANIVTVDGLANIMQATKIMKQHNVKTLIVNRATKDDAYDIVTATDISRAIAELAEGIAEGRDPMNTYVCEVMTKPCIVINPNLSAEHIPKLFAKAKIRIAPVIQDKLLGVVSITDILTKTDYLTQKANFISRQKKELDELPRDLFSNNEWEIVDWEREFDNWCSG
ncbi:MAG: CBS domain-containing protein [Cyanobacteria bacterium P01_A01_bin.83]